MRTDILMVTHGKDFVFAWYALRSIKKYATGFGDVLVVVPLQDLALFTPLVVQLGFRIGGFAQRPDKGMLHHMAIKMEADIWCPHADAILHMDADCLFTEPVAPDDYFVDGKPILYRERYERFKHYAARYSWKQCVLDSVGIDPEWETMVRHPSVHIAAVYVNARYLMDTIHGDWKEWWLSGRNEFPQDRAEFPTLGAVAIKHAQHLYHFVDFEVNTPDGGYVYEKGRDKVRGYWSHGGTEKHLAELEAIIA